MDCIFCKIIKGELPSKTLYENDKVKVILDIDPFSSGHCLVLPKEHIQDIDTIDDDTLLEVFSVAKIIKKQIIEKLNVDGCTFIENNGYGQAIKHFHLHIVPRVVDDGMEILRDKHGVKSADEVFELMQ